MSWLDNITASLGLPLESVLRVAVYGALYGEEKMGPCSQPSD